MDFDLCASCGKPWDDAHDIDEQDNGTEVPCYVVRDQEQFQEAA